MEDHAKKCVERYCELANRTTQQLYKVSTPCLDDHQFKEEDLKSVGELAKVCSQMVLKSFFLARVGRPDIQWSVNKLARSLTKWTKACDKRLSRLISYIHHICEYKQHCYVGNTAQQRRLGLFQDSVGAYNLQGAEGKVGKPNRPPAHLKLAKHEVSCEDLSTCNGSPDLSGNTPRNTQKHSTKFSPLS